MTDEQRLVLQGLHDLGGTDQAPMDIPKKLGFDKKFPDAPRAHPSATLWKDSTSYTLLRARKQGSSAKPASNPSNVGLNEGVLKAAGRVVPGTIRPANTETN